MQTATVRRALQIINQEIATVTVEGLCERLRVARPTLYEEFKQCLGETPGFTIRKTRLSRLCGVLDDNPGLAMQDAAVRCGYSSDSSAIRAFGDICGFTPAAFEKMARMRGRHMTSLFEDEVD
jgi:methylphosphotriester-DNA--protein-cysteine methyltransferase